MITKPVLLKYLLVVSICAVSSFAAYAHGGGCNVPRFHFNAGGTTPIRVYALRDSPCFLRLRATNLSVSRARGPAHGVLQRSSVSNYVYHPTRGYLGPDYIELNVRYNPSGSPTSASTKIEINIEVIKPQ